MSSLGPTVAQQDLLAVEGDPLIVTVAAVFTNPSASPYTISWADITDPVVSVGGNEVLAPTIVTTEGQWTLTWTADQIAKLSPSIWTLSVTIEGSGPYALIAGEFSAIGPDGDTSAVHTGTLTTQIGVIMAVLTVSVI